MAQAPDFWATGERIVQLRLRIVDVSAFFSRRFNALAIRRLKAIQCNRGVRHIQGLPCRGRKTKNNCRTLKGKGVVIARKEEAPR